MSFWRRASARAPCSVLFVAGQIIGALAIDRFGLFGLALRELTFGRLAGAFLVFIGALMVRLT